MPRVEFTRLSMVRKLNNLFDWWRTGEFIQLQQYMRSSFATTDSWVASGTAERSVVECVDL